MRQTTLYQKFGPFSLHPAPRKSTLHGHTQRPPCTIEQYSVHSHSPSTAHVLFDANQKLSIAVMLAVTQLDELMVEVRNARL